MNPTVLTFYVLMWPVLVAIVLFVICRAFLSEWRDAHRRGEDII